jgi:glycosyltransferase involved in cell wall biosynthesis
MKTLFVTRKYPPTVGGMEAQSYYLTTGFPGPKTIIALRGSQKNLVWFLPYALVRVAFSAFRYDVVHLGDSLLGVVGLVPRFLFRRPVFVTVHGLDMTFGSKLYQFYLKHFLRGSTYVAVSASTRAIAESRALGPVAVIPVGVPDHFFGLERDPEADLALSQQRRGRVVVLTVGRLVRRKGVAWFIRNVLGDLPEVLYVVVGVGPDRADIERAIAETGTFERVLLLGSVNEARLHDLLRSADVFVMPNIVVPGDVEGFGIVALEAAASGLSVVAADLQGIKDAIVHGDNGILVPPEDAARFSKAIRELCEDGEARARLGAKARIITGQLYGWPGVVRRYEELFHSLTGGPIGKRRPPRKRES